MAALEEWCAPSWQRAPQQPPSGLPVRAYPDSQMNFRAAGDPLLRGSFDSNWQCRKRCRYPDCGRRPFPPLTGPRDPLCLRHRAGEHALSLYSTGPMSLALPARTEWAGAQIGARPSIVRARSCRRCPTSAPRRTCDEKETPPWPARSHRG
jgi:hypothetical protein